MSNAPQGQKPQAQKSDNSSPSNAGNNPRKDEPNAKKKTGGMKDDACSTSGNKSSSASKTAKAS